MNNNTTTHETSSFYADEIKSSIKDASQVFTSENLNKYVEVAKTEMKKFESTLRSSFEKQPILVLCGSLATGFLLGMLVKRLAPQSDNSRAIRS